MAGTGKGPEGAIGRAFAGDVAVGGVRLYGARD